MDLVGTGSSDKQFPINGILHGLSFCLDPQSLQTKRMWRFFSPKQSDTLDLPPSPIEWPPGILPCFTTESQPKTCKFTTALHPAWGVDPSTHHWSGPHLRCSQSRQLGDCHPGSGNGACFVRFVQHVFNDKSRNRQRNIPSSKLTWQWNTFINGLLNR